jgi:hypothetical protein
MDQIKGWCMVCGKITNFMRLTGKHYGSILCTNCQTATTRERMEERTKEHPFKTGIYYCKEVQPCQ